MVTTMMTTIIKPCDKYNDKIKIILFYGDIKKWWIQRNLD